MKPENSLYSIFVGVVIENQLIIWEISQLIPFAIVLMCVGILGFFSFVPAYLMTVT